MPIGFFSTNPAVGQGIAAYNEDLNREALARIQGGADTERAQIAARAQQQAIRANAEQNAFLNAMRQQEIAQQGQYQTGVLANQRALSDAQLAWQKAIAGANAAEAEKERALKRDLAEKTLQRYQPSAYEIEDVNNQAQAMAGRFNFLLKDLFDRQAEEEKAVNSKHAENLSRITPFTFDSTFTAKRDADLEDVRKRYRSDLKNLLMGVPTDAPLDFDSARKMFVPRILRGQTTGTATVPPPSAAPAMPRPFFGDVDMGDDIAPDARSNQPDRGAIPIHVRLSDGTVVTGPNRMWAALKARDPGAEQVAPGSAAQRPITAPSNAPVAVESAKTFFGGATPPAASASGNTPGMRPVEPSVDALAQLRKVLRSEHGVAEIGKTPISSFFGWTMRDVPKLADAVAKAERGESIRDVYGNEFSLTSDQIAEAKRLLASLNPDVNAAPTPAAPPQSAPQATYFQLRMIPAPPRAEDTAPSTNWRTAVTQPAPSNPADRRAGESYSTPKGILRWSGSGWTQP